MDENLKKLERLKKERAQIRRGFTRCYNTLSEQLQEANLENFAGNYSKLADKAERLFFLDTEVSDLLYTHEEDEQVLSTEFDESESYREKWVSIKSKYESMRASEERNDRHSADSVSNVGSTMSHSKQLYHLPKLNLTKFDGNLKQYIGFWAQFKNIHEDGSLDNETKFQYLIQSTVENSPARELVNSYPPSSQNYPKVIEQFTHRFGRKELLIELYVRELLNLVLSQSMGKTLTLKYLYDQLESQLRSLETLGVTSDMYACMLFPLAESALPEHTLKEWHRQQSSRLSLVISRTNDSGDKEVEPQPQKHKLEELLAFLRLEVEAEERLSLAHSTFSNNEDKSNQGYGKKDKGLSAYKRSGRNEQVSHYASKSVGLPVSTAASLVNLKDDSKAKSSCIFCEGTHPSPDCLKARNLNLSEKKKRLSEKRGCFACSKIGHSRRQCKAFLKCIVCNGHHIPLLCPKLDETEKSSESSKVEQDQAINKEVSLHSNIDNKVFLQTLRVTLIGGEEVTVRALIDTGCQRTYIRKSVAEKQKYVPLETVTLAHSLFGGGTTSTENHNCYLVRVKHTNGNFSCNFKALDQDVICNTIPSVQYGPWSQELKEFGIEISDLKEGPVDILIGADIAGKLFTGQKRELKCGLIAMETALGWTLMGKMKQPDFSKSTEKHSMLVSSMLSLDRFSVSQLWDLDVLGIKDSIEVGNKKEISTAAQDKFLEGLKTYDDGRYEVELPWTVDHPNLPNNYASANRRLMTTLKKLEEKEAIPAYDQVFQEWNNNGIIEVIGGKQDEGYYLPHRPVFKDKGTTKIRPVFDGSAFEKGFPSLNQCLEKGLNLLEEIPPLLIRFRLNEIGVVSDIEKAFLQIGLSQKDRNYLKFLWIDKDLSLKVYRHARVVFGISSSPFLLNAVIDYHLKKCKELSKESTCLWSESVIDKLRRSFYVDNCVTSVKSQTELQKFINEATFVFSKACFNLRGWEFSQPDLVANTYSNVLGMTWDRKNDTLKLNLDNIKKTKNTATVTRRIILSIAQRIFDVIGFTAPVSLYPKLLLQQTWIDKGGWDEEVNEEIKTKFLSWLETIHLLEEIEVPRWVKTGNSFVLTLHTFCDASQLAYASAVFLCVETENDVFVRLIQAKSRVSPIKRATIPRLELLATLIGARLTHFVLQEIKDVQQIFLWSDSTTALTWIKQEDNWGVFVNNRVKEIRELTKKKDWNHIPGVHNPADLLSRGCSPKQLVNSEWWEGPTWLKLPPSEWPTSEVKPNKEEIESELKKSSLATVGLSNRPSEKFGETIGNRYSDYFKIVKIIAWILRFKNNCVNKSNIITKGLSTQEFKNAESVIVKIIQNEVFNGLQSNELRSLQVFYDTDGVIRLRTKISERPDLEAFRVPAVLPSKHKLVERLICSLHKKNGHIGTQGLLNMMRENFWLLKGRQTIKRILNSCVICKRSKSKNFEACSPPLPEARVRDAACFEVTGVDFAGPLFLRNGSKAWICLFTCAVYRALHLELVLSLTTECFVLALRRFIARRGRPAIMYSDQGKTFIGLENAMSRLDWDAIAKSTLMDRIDWRFNPPSAPWWGGFWERLVGVVKQCLKKMLGKAVLNSEEITTILCDCESLINNRPITYTTEDNLECAAITPAMYIQDIKDCRVIDLDKIESTNFERRLKYVKRVREDLRKRFRIEYLGQLKLSSGKNSRSPSVGEVVLIGSDNTKRQNWPLGLIKNVFPGKDGVPRVVRVKTAYGLLDRPIQRIYPLEIFRRIDQEEMKTEKPQSFVTEEPKLSDTLQEKVIKPPQTTRRGREVKLPRRLMD